MSKSPLVDDFRRKFLQGYEIHEADLVSAEDVICWIRKRIALERKEAVRGILNEICFDNGVELTQGDVGWNAMEALKKLGGIK